MLCLLIFKFFKLIVIYNICSKDDLVISFRSHVLEEMIFHSSYQANFQQKDIFFIERFAIYVSVEIRQFNIAFH